MIQFQAVQETLIILKLKRFLVQIKLFFGAPDLTNYPFYLFKRPKLKYSNKLGTNYRYLIHLISDGKVIKLSRIRFVFNFLRMRVLIKNDKSPLTLTINDKVSFENSLLGTKKLLVIYIDGLSSFKSESSNLLKDLMPAAATCRTCTFDCWQNDQHQKKN